MIAAKTHGHRARGQGAGESFPAQPARLGRGRRRKAVDDFDAVFEMNLFIADLKLPNAD
jgi:hypothetical protein